MLRSILFYNESINGSAFNVGKGSSYLHGNVGDRMKMVAEFEQILQDTPDANDRLEYAAVTATTGQLLRSIGSFLDEGFFPGQELELLEMGFGSQRQLVKVTFSSDAFLNFDIISGTMADGVYDGNVHALMQLTCLSNITGFVYRYGLIENTEVTNYLSKYNGRAQEFKAYGIAPNTVSAATANKGSHVNGSLQVQYISNSGGTHKFRVTHYFLMAPQYLDEFAQNISDETVPALFLTQNSLKYVFEAEMRYDSNNPNNVLIEQFDLYKGAVGWYGEKLDSNVSDFSVTEVQYWDDVTGIKIDSIKPDSTTLVIATIAGNFVSTTSIIVKILTARGADNYQKSLANFADTFLYDSVECVGANTTLGSGIIKSLNVVFTSAIVAEVRIKIQYTSGQRSVIDQDQFLLALAFADQAKALNNSNKCTHVLGFQEYADFSDVPGLLTWLTAGVYAHNDTASLKSSYRGWPQDGVRIKWTAEIVLGNLLAGLKYQVVAMNAAGSRFVINEYVASLGNPPVAILGAQMFNIDSTRGFKLAATDPFNEVALTTTESSPYRLEGIAGLKVGWQSWIANSNVPAAFVDTTKPKNNLNQLASNYKAQGYTLYLAVVATVQDNNGVETDYAQHIVLDAYAVNTDAGTPAEWTVAIQILDVNNDNTGALKDDEYNYINAIITPVSGSTAGYASVVGIVRMEKFEQPGEAVYELSSLRDTFTDNLLEPLVGQSLLQVTDNTTFFTLKCRVDGRKLEKGATYLFGARIFHAYSGVLAPVFRIDAVTYTGSGLFTMPVHAKNGAGANLPAGKQVTITVQSGATTQEILSGVIGSDISNFATSHAVPAKSIVKYADQIVQHAAVLDFDKYGWAVQNGKTNANANTVTLTSVAVDRGVSSAADTEVIPIKTIPGKGYPKDIELLATNQMVFADFLKGIRILKNDAYTELLGVLAGASSVDVDVATPANPRIYCPDSVGNIRYWDNTNRADLGFSGTAKTAWTETFTPTTLYVNEFRAASGYSDVWVCGTSKLILRYRNGAVFSRADFSSKVTAISATAVVQSVVMDANGVLWILCNVPASGSLVISMAKTGGGLYQDPTQWTATLRISNPGTGTTNGISGTARFSGDTRKIIIIGYDGVIGTMVGTNPMMLISDYGNDFYRLLQSVVGVWTVSSPGPYCGTPATNTYTFGIAGSNIEVGKVSGMCYVDGVGSPGKLYGTGEGTPDRIIFALAAFSDAIQIGTSLFEGTTGYLEQTTF